MVLYSWTNAICTHFPEHRISLHSTLFFFFVWVRCQPCTQLLCTLCFTCFFEDKVFHAQTYLHLNTQLGKFHSPPQPTPKLILASQLNGEIDVEMFSLGFGYRQNFAFDNIDTETLTMRITKNSVGSIRDIGIHCASLYGECLQDIQQVSFGLSTNLSKQLFAFEFGYQVRSVSR